MVRSDSVFFEGEVEGKNESLEVDDDELIDSDWIESWFGIEDEVRLTDLDLRLNRWWWLIESVEVVVGWLFVNFLVKVNDDGDGDVDDWFESWEVDKTSKSKDDCDRLLEWWWWWWWLEDGFKCWWWWWWCDLLKNSTGLLNDDVKLDLVVWFEIDSDDGFDNFELDEFEWVI